MQERGEELLDQCSSISKRIMYAVSKRRFWPLVGNWSTIQKRRQSKWHRYREVNRNDGRHLGKVSSN